MSDISHIGKLKPLPNHVFIRIEPPRDEVSEGGVFIPEAVGENQLDCTGHIVDVGEGVNEVKIGDRVLFDLTLATDSPIDSLVKIVRFLPGHVIGVLDEDVAAEVISVDHIGQHKVKR